MHGGRAKGFGVCLLAAVVLIPFYSVEAAAVAARISGKVTDKSTGEALPGASVVIAGTSIGAATDLKGKYSIPPVSAGSYTLVVTYVGYKRQERAITLVDGQNLVANFELDWEGVMGEEVVVTAQASAQIGAINQQWMSNTITNVVSAARIREIPDVNAAESVGRLPGVSIQRSGGEANKIAIRGLSPKYNTVTVNGVRVPSTGADDRSVDLSLISSNMLDGIEVMKAITADKDADAIGGSVDLKLREAPEGLQFDLLTQGGYNQLQNYYGNYKVNASVSNRTLRNRLGVIANFNLDEFDRSADKFSGDYRQSSNPQSGLPIIIVSNIGVREETVVRGRTGASLVLDYRLPKGKISANTFYNRLHFDGLFRINQMNAENNRHYYNTEERSGATAIFTGAIAVEQDFSWVQFDAGVARTASRTENPENFYWQFAQEGNAFNAQPTENTLPNEIPTFLNIDTLRTGLQDAFVYSTLREENESAVQLNIKAPFRFGNRLTGYIKTGGKLRWLDKLNDEEQDGRNGLYYGSGAGNLSPTFECISGERPEWGLDELIGNLGVLPISFVNSDYSRDDFMDGEYPLGFAPDTEKLRQLIDAMRACGTDIYRNYAIGSLGRDYDGVERYQAGYAMAEINIGRKITFLPGIRWEGDYSRYNGQRYRETAPNNVQGPPAELEEIQNIRENDFWLPMLHLQVRPTGWLQVRLARTETLTRPDFIQYAPITTINSFRSYVRASNGLLRPAQATNYDAAVAVFEKRIGLFSVAAFRKSIKDLILWVDFNLHPDVGALPGTNIPDAWIEARPRANTFINNPFDAIYQGFEIDWQTNFWYLPSFLKGLVLNANYTYLESETTYQAYYIVDSDSLIRRRPPVYLKILKTDSVRTARMPDQPTHIANLTVGYDYRGFSARLSFLYQTDTSTFINSTNPLFDTFSGDYSRLDLSVKQRLGRGLEFFVNVNNLNSRPDRNFRGANNANPSYIEYYGLTTDIGARYRF